MPVSRPLVNVVRYCSKNSRNERFLLLKIYDEQTNEIFAFISQNVISKCGRFQENV